MSDQLQPWKPGCVVARPESIREIRFVCNPRFQFLLTLLDTKIACMSRNANYQLKANKSK